MIEPAFSLSIPLDLPPGDSQQAFLDHFNAALRGISSNHTGSASFRPDGTFQSSVTVAMPISGQPATLSWTVNKSTDGQLTNIAIETGTPGLEAGVWQPAAQAVVTTALANALSNKQQKFFRRVQFHYIGPELDGEYQLPGLRLSPAIPPDETAAFPHFERVVYIDMNIDAIDGAHATAVADEVARRHAARLSLLLNIGLFRPVVQHRWVLPLEAGQTAPRESKREQLGFMDPRPQPTEMPDRGVACRAGEYAGTLKEWFRGVGGTVKCPKGLRQIMRGLEGAKPRIADAFDRCARLWQVANVIGTQYPSAGLAYRVAAGDAIAQGNPEYASFSDFVRKNSAATESRGDLGPALEYLWGAVRSGHFHAGEFPMGEFAPMRFFDPVMDSQVLQVSALQTNAYHIIHNAIVTWLIKEVSAGDV